MSTEHIHPPPLWVFISVRVSTEQNCVSTGLTFSTEKPPAPATSGDEPIFRHSDYTPKPTSVPLCPNPSFQTRHWASSSTRLNLSQDYLHTQPCEDEGLHLEESTVLHQFPFHRAKSCPQIILCALMNQRETLIPVTPTETLWFQRTLPSKWTQQREGISTHNIKTKKNVVISSSCRLSLPYFCLLKWPKILWEGN